MLETTPELQRAIADLCRYYRVQRLELFGSAATDAYDPTNSDVDLIVEFSPQAELGPWMKSYFELRDRLQALLGRPVDLVMAGAMQDQHFVREANRTRTTLYAA